MTPVNAHYAALHGSYLFSEIGRQVESFSRENAKAKLIRLGIGDVVLPIVPNVVEALSQASNEMGEIDTFRGYAPSAGYDFLIDAIVQNEYAPLHVALHHDDVFISDGAKSDTANFQELFSSDSVAAICDPVYPVYVDSNKMAGRKIVYLPCEAPAGFLPALPNEKVDMIYLCSPNNPTGVAFSNAQLTKWVEYARQNNTVIFHDAAYRAYIESADTPGSIYQIDGTKEVAVEFCSFSKSAGFTGLRCAWTIVPKENRWGLNSLWARRMSTKFNGVAYPVQRAAEAALTPEGKALTAVQVAYYKENARILKGALESEGISVYGGQDAPYLWARCPEGMDGWMWFDWLLRQKGIVVTPGEGFGSCGAGYARFSSFALQEDVMEAAGRLTERAASH